MSVKIRRVYSENFGGKVIDIFTRPNPNYFYRTEYFACIDGKPFTPKNEFEGYGSIRDALNAAKGSIQ